MLESVNIMKSGKEPRLKGVAVERLKKAIVTYFIYIYIYIVGLRD